MAKLTEKSMLEEATEALDALAAGNSHGPAVAGNSHGPAVAGSVSAQAAAPMQEAPVDASTANNAPAASLYIPLTEIEPDPDQPRKFSNEEGGPAESLQDLANSILQHGVIQPITVRRDGDKYQIVAGERRWRASNIALQSGNPCQRKGYDLGRIPAVIVEPESSLDRLEMQMVENLAREDMADTDTAAALRALYEQLDVGMEELAKRIGKSKSWVSVMLARTRPEAQKVVEALGVPVDSVGKLELSKLVSYWRDPSKMRVVESVAARLRAGETFSRSLLEEEEQRYTLEKRLEIEGRGLPLDDLRDLDREVLKGNAPLLAIVQAQESLDLTQARETQFAARQSPGGQQSPVVEPDAPAAAGEPAVAVSKYVLQNVSDDDLNFGESTDLVEQAVASAGGLGAGVQSLTSPTVFAVGIPQDLAEKILAKAGRPDAPVTSQALQDALRLLVGGD